MSNVGTFAPSEQVNVEGGIQCLQPQACGWLRVRRLSRSG